MSIKEINSGIVSVTPQEINKIKNISVMPLPKQVVGKADEIKTRMVGIVTDQTNGVVSIINNRLESIRESNVKIVDYIENHIGSNVIAISRDENGVTSIGDNEIKITSNNVSISGVGSNFPAVSVVTESRDDYELPTYTSTTILGDSVTINANESVKIYKPTLYSPTTQTVAKTDYAIPNYKQVKDMISVKANTTDVSKAFGVVSEEMQSLKERIDAKVQFYLFNSQSEFESEEGQEKMSKGDSYGYVITERVV